MDTNFDADQLLDSLQDQELAARIRRIYQQFVESAVRFEEQKVKDTIVFFGSAQLVDFQKAQKGMQEVEILFDNSKRRTQKQWDALDEASNRVYMARYYDAAEHLAEKLAAWGKKQKKHEYLICSGGGPGIMEATNKGASQAGARSIGLAIDIPAEQDRNVYITPELRFLYRYFFIRKFWFFYYAKAIIIFPGGFGTYDEVFDILNLMKTGKINRKIPIVLYGKEYWDEVLNFEPMIRYGTIDAEDVETIHYSDSIDDAYDFVTSQLEKHFMKK